MRIARQLPTFQHLQPFPVLSKLVHTRTRYALLAAMIGLCIGGLRLVSQIKTNDLWLAYGSAQLFWQGADPYLYPTGGWPSNPMTTVLVLAPAAWLPMNIVGAGLVAISTALLVYGSLQTGEPWRLWVLASWPFWYNMLFAQWGILFLAILLLPSLAWLTPIKPQLGLSVFLSHFRWRQVVYTLIFLAASWLAAPGWPARWLAQLGGYDGFLPIMYAPLALLAALIVWRVGLTHKSIFFVLFCFTPQRLWHDQVLLWYVPGRPWMMVLLSLSSWASLITIGAEDVQLWQWVSVATVFLPAGLSLIVARSPQTEPAP